MAQLFYSNHKLKIDDPPKTKLECSANCGAGRFHNLYQKAEAVYLFDDLATVIRTKENAI